MSANIRLRISDKDRERLELIRAAYGVSLSAAARVAIRAACQRLGFEKDTDDLLKEK